MAKELGGEEEEEQALALIRVAEQLNGGKEEPGGSRGGDQELRRCWVPGLCLLPTQVLRLHLLEELDDELEFDTGLTSSVTTATTVRAGKRTPSTWGTGRC